MIFRTLAGSGGGETPFVLGTYTGTSNPMALMIQTIPLGFTPSAVLATGTNNTDMILKGVEQSTLGMSIVEGGFQVGKNTNVLNQAGVPYSYIAFK